MSHENDASSMCAGEAEPGAMMALIEELYPICRNITGNGVRQTLEILRRYILSRSKRSLRESRSWIGPCRANGTSEVRT